MPRALPRPAVLAAAAGAVLAPSLSAGTVRAQTASPAAPERAYTLTLADKRGLALPPHVLKPLPKQVTLRVRLTTEAGGPGAGAAPVLRLFGLPMPGDPADAPGFGFASAVTLDGATGPLQGRAVFGPRSATAGGGAGSPYAAEILAERSPGGGDTFRLSLPARQGRSAAGAAILHPLAAQLTIGRQYDFRRGGPQTFALLQDWDGDALNPASELGTLRLEAKGTAKITLDEGAVEARRLGYTLSAVRGGAAARTGVLLVGPRGELLQADPPVFGIPFDGGRAKGPASSEDGAAVLRTDKGETIKGRPRSGGGYDIELYGKPAAPFATATLDAAGRLARVSERWNGRERVSIVGPNEVRFTFSAGGLGEVTAPPDRAWFLAHWFATDTWETGNGPFAAMPVGGKKDGTFLPLVLRGEYGRPFTLERLPDLRAAGTDAPVRRYRMTLDAGAARFDLFTDGRRLVHLTGADGGVGLTITRDGGEAVAAAATTAIKTVSPAP